MIVTIGHYIIIKGDDMERLIMLRKQSDKTQQDMADFLGVSRPTYTKWELGGREPDFETLKKLAAYFGTTTSYIIGEIDDPIPPNKNKSGINLEKLRELREATGKTQDDIALYLNVGRNTVSRYESGEREPDLQTIKKLADYFNVTTDYLLGRITVQNLLNKKTASFHMPLEEIIMNSSEVSEEGKQIMLQHLKLVKVLDKAKSGNEFASELKPDMV